MKRVPWIALPALALAGACLGELGPDGPPYRLDALRVAGVPERCTEAERLAAPDTLPVEDAPDRFVRLEDGVPLCIDAGPAPNRPARDLQSVPLADEPVGLPRVTGLGDAPRWTATEAAEEKTGNKPEPGPGPLGGLTGLGDIVKDPTPQPATPSPSAGKTLTAPPPRPGSSSQNGE